MPAANHVQVIRNLIGVLVKYGGRATAAASTEIAVDGEIHIVRRRREHIHTDVRQINEIGSRSACNGQPSPRRMEGIDRGGIDRIGIANCDRLTSVRDSTLGGKQQVVVEGRRTLVV